MTTWMTRYIDAWDRLDADAVSAFHSEDGICEDVGPGDIFKGEGRHGRIGAMGRAKFPRLPVQHAERATVRGSVCGRVGGRGHRHW